MHRLMFSLAALSLVPACGETVTSSDELVVISISPAGGQMDVDVGATVVATFSRTLDDTSVTSSSVWLEDGDGLLVDTTITYSADAWSILVVPNDELELGTEYTLVLSDGVTDEGGNALAATVTSSFTTAITDNGGGDDPGPTDTDTEPPMDDDIPSDSDTDVPDDDPPTDTEEPPPSAPRCFPPADSSWTDPGPGLADINYTYCHAGRVIDGGDGFDGVFRFSFLQEQRKSVCSYVHQLAATPYECDECDFAFEFEIGESHPSSPDPDLTRADGSSWCDAFDIDSTGFEGFAWTWGFASSYSGYENVTMYYSDGYGWFALAYGEYDSASGMTKLFYVSPYAYSY